MTRWEIGAALVLGVFVAALIACGAAMTSSSPTAAQPCPTEILRSDAVCTSPAPGLYEYNFADGRRAWCRDAGSAAWCSSPTSPTTIPSGPPAVTPPVGSAHALLMEIHSTDVRNASALGYVPHGAEATVGDLR